MAKARAIKRNHAIFLRGQINQAAGLEVLDHAPIAVQEDQRRSCSPLDVVEANTFHGNESPDWRVTALSFFCKPPVQKGGHDGGRNNTSRDRKSLAHASGRGQVARSRIRKIHDSASVRCTTARAPEGCCTAGQQPIQPFVPAEVPVERRDVLREPAG